jgi:hypothetical protein
MILKKEWTSTSRYGLSVEKKKHVIIFFMLIPVYYSQKTISEY